MLNLDEGITVLSLFDGMSCGRIALERAGIKVKAYYASEIDKPAIKVSKHNWPDIIHIGDVTKVFYFEGWLYTENGDFYVGKIDLLIGGSPCQGFSFAGKQLNFEDPRSKLFFEFVRLRQETECEYFFLENVRMKKEYQDIISGYLSVQPIFINSDLVSAQTRKRLYWSNIFYNGLPEDKNILLKDILLKEIDIKFLLSEAALNRAFSKKYSLPKFDSLKTGCLNTKNNSGQLSIDSGTAFIACEDKSLTLTTTYRYNANITDYVVKRNKQLIKIGNTHPSGRGMNGIIYDSEGQAPTLTTNKGEGQKIRCSGDSFNWTYRRLTPVECERLQNVPDNYSNSVSDSQRYKMLGNGWTVDVITHLFEPLKYDVI